MQITITDLSDLDNAANKILNLSSSPLFLIYGEMGVGKTTLIKAIGKQLNTLDEVTSPTFAIANVYETEQGNKWFHIDLYRIKAKEELQEIGIDEYLYSGNYCFIEWPEQIEPFIDGMHITEISISMTNNNKRIIEINNVPYFNSK